MRSHRTPSRSRSLRGLSIGLAAAALPLAIAACQVNPVTGDSEINFMSFEEEKELGDAAVEEIVVQLGGEYPDPALMAYVNGIGQSVVKAGRDHIKAAKRDFPDWQFKFHIVNDSMINAFALPGGNVFVTRGILEKMDAESQLAGLLGHESGHVFLRHGARSQSQQLLIMLPVALGAALLSDNEDTAWIAGVSALAANFLLLKYSRDHESEADRWGMDFSVHAKYEADGIINLMRMLEKEGGGGTPEFLSTHPAPENRIKTLTALKQKEYATATVANGYQSNAAQLSTAKNTFAATRAAYAALDEGDAIVAAIAENASPAASKSAHTAALAKYQAAAKAAPTHGLLHRKVGETLITLDRFKEAIPPLEQARKLDGADFFEDFLYGAALSKSGRHADALVALDATLAKAPANPLGLLLAGDSAKELKQRDRAKGYYMKAFDLVEGDDAQRKEFAARVVALGYPDPTPPPPKPKAKSTGKSGGGEDESAALADQAAASTRRMPRPGDPGVVVLRWGDRRALYALLGGH